MLLAGNQTKLRASEIARPPHGARVAQKRRPQRAERAIVTGERSFLCERRRRRRRIPKRDARGALEKQIATQRLNCLLRRSRVAAMEGGCADHGSPTKPSSTY